MFDALCLGSDYRFVDASWGYLQRWNSREFQLVPARKNDPFCIVSVYVAVVMNVTRCTGCYARYILSVKLSDFTL